MNVLCFFSRFLGKIQCFFMFINDSVVCFHYTTVIKRCLHVCILNTMLSVFYWFLSESFLLSWSPLHKVTKFWNTAFTFTCMCWVSYHFIFSLAEDEEEDDGHLAPSNADDAPRTTTLVLGSTTEMNSAPNRPSGRVVGIIKRNWHS